MTNGSMSLYNIKIYIYIPKKKIYFQSVTSKSNGFNIVCALDSERNDEKYEFSEFYYISFFFICKQFSTRNLVIIKN